MLQFLNAVIQERTCLPKPIYFTAFLLSKYALLALLAKIEFTIEYSINRFAK